MYDELVKRLHNRRICIQQSGGLEDFPLLQEAADAIEELAAFKAQITDGHFYCMKAGVLYEAKVDLPKGNVIQLPPIEFAEPPKEG